MVYMFRKFDPVRRMITSRDSGNINELFSITKSEIIDLYYIWDMSDCDNDTPEMTEEEIAYEDSHPEYNERFQKELAIDEFRD